MTPFTADPLTRRRFLASLSAAATTLALSHCRSDKQAIPATDSAGDYTWTGIGFGIEMSMEIPSISASQGERLGAYAEKSIQDFERAFSLYQESSELSILNRDRTLANPSPLFRSLLDRSVELCHRCLGYYQPAIHGVWILIDNPDQAITPEHWLAADLAFVEITPDGHVHLKHRLTQLSMNAIAQGFLADCIATQLRAEGITCALLQFGETYAIGEHPQKRPWKLAVTGTSAKGETDIVGHAEFSDAGLAVSAQDATRNLIDPVTRRIHREARVTAIISSEGAAVADAFATAFAVAPASDWPRLAASLQQAPRAQIQLWVDQQLRFRAP